jgi:hypothetical protein
VAGTAPGPDSFSPGWCAARTAALGTKGVTRQKGKPRLDGSKVKTFSYACGGYIAKGTSACQFNPVSQGVLEPAVIAAVLKFYARFEGTGGREKMLAVVRTHLGVEAADLAQARKRLDADLAKVESTIANLLDHITERSRDMVEQRLSTLRSERTRLSRRGEELEHLALEQTHVADTGREVGKFLSGLAFTLHHGLPDERMSALRRCVQSIVVNRPESVATMTLRTLPRLGSLGEGSADDDGATPQQRGVETVMITLPANLPNRGDTSDV